MSEYTIKTVSGSVVRFDDAENGLPLTKCEVNIVPKVEIGTVSGSIVTFFDGADDVPLRSCEVTIAPNLDGVSSVDVVNEGKNLISAPEYTNNTSTMCLDLGSNITFSYVTSSFLATNTVVSYTNAAVVDFREEDGTHHYLTLSRFYNENNVQFTANTQQNGRYRCTYSNITFRYVYIYYMSNSYSFFSSDSVTEWQLEVGSTATSYEPYNATTYTASLGRTIYSGIADVVNGTLEPINWINDTLSGIEQGTITSDGGTNQSSNTRIRNTSLMPFPLDEIRESYTLTIPSGWKLAMRFYKSDGTFVSMPSWAIGFINQIPSTLVGQGVQYARFVFAKTDDSNITPEDVKNIGYQCEKGSTATTYSSYFTPFTFTPVSINSHLGYTTMWSDGDLNVTYYKKEYNTKKVNILHYEKNILKISDNNYNNGQKYNYIITEDGIEVTATGTYARVGFAISIKKGATYTFSFRGYATSSYRRIYLNSNIDTPWTSPTYNGFQLTDTDTAYSRTFTALTDVLFIGFYVTAAETTGTMTVSDIMLEVSSSASEYEPYIVPTTHTVNLGRTIYGGSADIAMGKGSETHGNVVFDGTEGTGGTPSWTMISVTQGTMFRITVPGKATTSATNTACSYYTPTAQAQRADGTVSGAGEYVDIIDNRFSSVDAFKAWLAENPVALVYELATPEPFTFTPIDLTSNSTNTLWSTEGDITVSYYSYVETDGRYIISGSTLTDIADAIREKTSIVGPINVNDFITDIMTIDDSAPDAEEVEF